MHLRLVQGLRAVQLLLHDAAPHQGRPPEVLVQRRTYPPRSAFHGRRLPRAQRHPGGQRSSALGDTHLMATLHEVRVMMVAQLNAALDILDIHTMEINDAGITLANDKGAVTGDDLLVMLVWLWTRQGHEVFVPRSILDGAT